jgi:hypothetical protein
MPGYGNPKLTPVRRKDWGRNSDNEPMLSYPENKPRQATKTTPEKAVGSTHTKSNQSTHEKNYLTKDNTSAKQKQEKLNRFERSDDYNVGGIGGRAAKKKQKQSI